MIVAEEAAVGDPEHQRGRRSGPRRRRSRLESVRLWAWHHSKECEYGDLAKTPRRGRPLPLVS